MTNEYTVLLMPSGKRSLKKLPKPIQKKLLNKALELKNNPLQGEKLQGVVHFVRSLHTRIQKSDYRIAYEVLEKKAEVLIHYVASRENFYKQLLRLNLKSLR